MKIKPLIGRRIRIGRQLHMNQPQEMSFFLYFLGIFLWQK